MSASPRNMLTSYRWISFTESVSGLSFEQQSWNGQLNWCCWAAVENTTCLSGKHHLSQWKTRLVSVENTTCLCLYCLLHMHRLCFLCTAHALNQPEAQSWLSKQCCYPHEGFCMSICHDHARVFFAGQNGYCQVLCKSTGMCSGVQSFISPASTPSMIPKAPWYSRAKHASSPPFPALSV